ncbi:TolC family protein [Selenomonas sp. oral taxon 138]|uniref:TolC family protein n=1 Tax=Selenomonas sp. oral taxon 138 TaxID=712532 RepID=UPI0002A45062|nr:TolC family protein [Selenomonas sp. oral taxon 138]EKX96599.1 outer membrane efflux protein [Selenomonas sp. oral taxon 138 str. F0429]
MYSQWRRRQRRATAAAVLGTVLFLPFSAHAMSLTLTEAIDTALAANTALRITAEGERSADAALKQARGKNSISAEAGDTLRTSKAKDEDAQTSNSLSLSARLPLYSGGANEANIESGEIGAQSARLTTERAREDLKYEVITAYWDAVEASKKVEVQRDTVNKYDAHLKNVTALYDAGAQAKIDVLRSSVELSNARQELISAENSYEVNLATLRNLLNIARTEPLTLTTEVTYQPFEKPMEDCISYAYRNRLDLTVERAKLRQRELAVESARAGKRPSVNLTLGTGLTSQFQPRHDTSSDVSASVGVSWNIFDSGVTRGAIEEAEAERDIALLNVRKEEESIDLNLRKAYLNMREAEQRFTSTGDVVRQAREDYHIANERYRTGEGILLDIIDAQTALATAETNAISARYDYARYRAQVENIMGTELTESEHAAAEGLPAVTAEERAAAQAAYIEGGTDAAAKKVK